MGVKQAGGCKPAIQQASPLEPAVMDRVRTERMFKAYASIVFVEPEERSEAGGSSARLFFRISGLTDSRNLFHLNLNPSSKE